jgi:anthranilate synthase component II
MRVLVFDSYDSFTWNLVQAFQNLGAQTSVVRCDQVTPKFVGNTDADCVVFGPGPGLPADAGCLLHAMKTTLGSRPLLGVCLGHQALGQVLGAQLVRAEPVHGYAPPIEHDGAELFTGLPKNPLMTRYHSLVIDNVTLPKDLQVTARSIDGQIMAVRHTSLPAWGVQFHPEAHLSGAMGQHLLGNFMHLARTASTKPAWPNDTEPAKRPRQREADRQSARGRPKRTPPLP